VTEGQIKELLKAVPSAISAKLTILEHPESMVVMSQDQIYGYIEKPIFDNDKIRATLAFNKKATPPDFLGKIKKGLMRDVSIGFYYQPEFKHGHWKGQTFGVLWECYLNETERTANWQETLYEIWQAVERDTKMAKIFTQPREPTFEEGYRDFLSRLGYQPDSESPGWWSRGK